MREYGGSIALGKRQVHFNVIYANRKTMQIAVEPDGRVVVRAPIGIAVRDIESRLWKRGRWIRKQLDYFQQFQPRTPPRRYVGGETHLYLGRQYRLKIQTGETNEVKLIGGFFLVTCRAGTEPGLVRMLMEDWYSRRARDRYAESLDRCIALFGHERPKRPKLAVRRMRTRWGSLSDKGLLTVNPRLVRASRECIDYVLTHELCHIAHQKHGPDFYRLLKCVMPDWRERKQRLELGAA